MSFPTRPRKPRTPAVALTLLIAPLLFFMLVIFLSEAVDGDLTESIRNPQIPAAQPVVLE